MEAVATLISGDQVDMNAVLVEVCILAVFVYLYISICNDCDH